MQLSVVLPETQGRLVVRRRSDATRLGPARAGPPTESEPRDRVAARGTVQAQAPDLGHGQRRAQVIPFTRGSAWPSTARWRRGSPTRSPERLAPSVEYMYLYPMPTSVRLPPAIEKRLNALATKTGRSKAFYVREMIGGSA